MAKKKKNTTEVQEQQQSATITTGETPNVVVANNKQKAPKQPKQPKQPQQPKQKKQKQNNQQQINSKKDEQSQPTIIAETSNNNQSSSTIPSNPQQKQKQPKQPKQPQQPKQKKQKQNNENTNVVTATTASSVDPTMESFNLMFQSLPPEQKKLLFQSLLQQQEQPAAVTVPTSTTTTTIESSSSSSLPITTSNSEKPEVESTTTEQQGKKKKKGEQQPKQPKQPKEPKQPKQPKQPKEPKQPKQPKEPKQPKQPKQPQEPKEPKKQKQQQQQQQKPSKKQQQQSNFTNPTPSKHYHNEQQLQALKHKFEKPLPAFFVAFDLLTNLEPTRLQQGLQTFIDESERLILENIENVDSTQYELIDIFQYPTIPHPVFVDKYSSSDFTSSYFYKQFKYLYDKSSHELKFTSLKKCYIYQLYYNDQFFIILSNIFKYIFDELPKKGNEYGEKISLLLQVKLFTVIMYMMRYILPQDNNEKAPILLRANQFINLVLPYLYKYYSNMAHLQEEKIQRRKNQFRLLSKRRRAMDQDDEDPNSYKADNILDNEAIWEYHMYILFNTIYQVTIFRPEWVCGSLLRGRSSNNSVYTTMHNFNQSSNNTSSNNDHSNNENMQDEENKRSGNSSTFNNNFNDVDNRNYRMYDNVMSSLSFKNIFFGLLKSVTDTKTEKNKSRHNIFIGHHLLFKILKSCHSYLTVKLPIDCKYCYGHQDDLRLLEPLLKTLEFTMVRVPKHRSQIIRSEVNQMLKYYVQEITEEKDTPELSRIEEFIYGFIRHGSKNLASIADYNSFNLLYQAIQSPYQFNTDAIWTFLQTLSIPLGDRIGNILIELLVQHPYMSELYLNTIFGNTHDKKDNVSSGSYRTFMYYKFNSTIGAQIMDCVTPIITMDQIKQMERSIPNIVSSILLEKSLLFSKEKLDFIFVEQNEASMMNLTVIQKILHIFVHVFTKFDRILTQLNTLKSTTIQSQAEQHESSTVELISQFEKELILEFRKRFPIQPSLFIQDVCLNRIINCPNVNPSPLLLDNIISLFKYYIKYYPDQTGNSNIGVLLPMISQIIIKYTKGKDSNEKSTTDLVSNYIDLLSEMNLSFYHDILPNLVISTNSGNILMDMILGIDYLAICEGTIHSTNYIKKAKLFTSMFSKDKESSNIMFTSKHDSMHWFMMTFFNDQSSIQLVNLIIKYITDNTQINKKYEELSKWDSQIFTNFMLYCMDHSTSVDFNYLQRVFIQKFIQSTSAFEKKNDLIRILKKETNSFKSKLISFLNMNELKSDSNLLTDEDNGDEFYYDNIEQLSLKIVQQGESIPYPILFYLMQFTDDISIQLGESITKFEYDESNAFEFVNCIKKRWLCGKYHSIYKTILENILSKHSQFKDLIFKDEAIIKSLEGKLEMIDDVIQLWKVSTINNGSESSALVYDSIINIVNNCLMNSPQSMAHIIDKIILENIQVFDYNKLSLHHVGNLLVRNKKNAKYVFDNVEKFGTFVIYLLLGVDNNILMKSVKERTRLVNIAELISVMMNHRMLLSTMNSYEILTGSENYHHLMLNLNYDEFTSLFTKIVQYTSKSFTLIQEEQSKQFLTELLCWYLRFSSKYHFVCLRELFRNQIPDFNDNPNILLILETIIKYYPENMKLPENLFKFFDPIDQVITKLLNVNEFTLPIKTILKHFVSNYTYDEKQFIRNVTERKLFELLSIYHDKSNLLPIYIDLVLKNTTLLKNVQINNEIKYHIENSKNRSNIIDLVNQWSRSVIENEAFCETSFEIFDLVSTKFSSTFYFETYYLEQPSKLYEHVILASTTSTTTIESSSTSTPSSLYHIVHFIYNLMTKFESTDDLISNVELFELLLSKYGATLNQTDVIIYLMFNIYEAKLTTPLANYHYQFGLRSICKQHKNTTQIGGSKMTEQEFLSCEWNNFHQQFDKNKVYNTINYIPYDINLYGNQQFYHYKDNYKQLIDNNQVYDIRYLLRYIMYCMTLFPLSSLYKQNSVFLSIALRGTSSNDYYVRMLAYEVIGMYYNFIVNHVNRNQESDIYEVLVLVLRQIKISMAVPYLKLSLPWSMMLSVIVNSILKSATEESSNNSDNSANKIDLDGDATMTMTDDANNNTSLATNGSAGASGSNEEDEDSTNLLVTVLESLRKSEHNVDESSMDFFDEHVRPLLTSTLLLSNSSRVTLRDISRFFGFQRPFLKLKAFPIHKDHVKSINVFGVNYLKVLLFGYQTDEDFMDEYIKNNTIQHLLMSFDQLSSTKSYQVYQQIAICRILIDVSIRLRKSREKLVKEFGLMDWIKTQLRKCTSLLISNTNRTSIRYESSSTEIIRLLMILICSIYNHEHDSASELLFFESSILISMIFNDPSLLSNMGMKTILQILKYCKYEHVKKLISTSTLQFNSQLIQSILQGEHLSNSEKIELIVELYSICASRDWNEISQNIPKLIPLLKDDHHSIFNLIQFIYRIARDCTNSQELNQTILKVISFLYYQYQYYSDLRYLEGLNRIVVFIITRREDSFEKILIKMQQTERSVLESFERSFLNSQLSIFLREKMLQPLSTCTTTTTLVSTLDNYVSQFGSNIQQQSKKRK